MRFSNLVALVLPVIALGRVAFASPTESTTVKAVAAGAIDPSKFHAKAVTQPSPASDRKIAVKGLSTKTSNNGFHALAPNTYIDILLCPGMHCSGECISYSLDPFDGYCYPSAIYFRSAEVYSDYYEGYTPFDVYVALANCYLPVSLEEMDTCYNLFYNGASYPFSYFGPY